MLQYRYKETAVQPALIGVPVRHVAAWLAVAALGWAVPVSIGAAIYHLFG